MGDQLTAWQDNKTLSERILYMLNNEIATDVCFETSSAEGSITLIRAHKFMLVASSPVFETMLCGTMAEARSDHGNIQITDIDTATFKEIIKYFVM